MLNGRDGSQSGGRGRSRVWRRWHAWHFAVLAALVIALVVWWQVSAGPRVAGRSMRSWTHSGLDQDGPRTEFLSGAGPEAYDWLMLEAMQSQTTGEFLLSKILKEFRFDWEPTERRREDALTALQTLGTNALPHLFEKLRQLPDGPRGSSPPYTSLLLGHFSGERRPWVVEQLKSLAIEGKNQARAQAIEALSRPPYFTPSVMPTIASASHDPDRWVRFEAIWGIRRGGIEASLAMPVMIAALQDPDSDIVRAALDGIKDRSQKEATPALPGLRELKMALDRRQLSDGSPITEDEARTLIARIDWLLSKIETTPLPMK